MNRGDRDVIMEVRARLGRWLKLLALGGREYGLGGFEERGITLH